ncbi:hypothetical protein B7463_g4863, partial [Scytalidium lignicola]
MCMAMLEPPRLSATTYLVELDATALVFARKPVNNRAGSANAATSFASTTLFEPMRKSLVGFTDRQGRSFALDIGFQKSSILVSMARGADSWSIVRAITDSFSDVLCGRPWMPLTGHRNPGRLEPDQIDPSLYSLEFLIKQCIAHWWSTDRSRVSFDITLEDESLSWKQISKLPVIDRCYETFWQSNWFLDDDLETLSDVDIDYNPDANHIEDTDLPVTHRLLMEEEEVQSASMTSETHESPESSHYDSETDSTATSTTDSSCFYDGGGEVVERSVKLNKTNLVNQVLVYIRYLVQGIIVASGGTVQHTSNCEQPGRTIGQTTSGSNSNSQGRKRHLDADGYRRKNSPSDEEDGGHNDGRGRMGSKGLAEPKCNLACPFFKHNPRKYMYWRSCPGPGWNTVHRIKEHLYRRHSLPKFFCDRCFGPFQDADSLRLHHRADTQCSVREAPEDALEGMTAAQELQLRSRKRSRIGVRDTEHEKWIHIYQVLFPGETEIPSPYYDYEETKTQQCKQSNLLGDSGNYEIFLRQELPPLLQEELRQLVEQEIEEELCAIPPRVKEKLKGKAINAVQKFQLTLFTRYQDSQANSTGDVGDHSISLTASRDGVGAGNMLDPQQLLDDFDWNNFDLDGILGETI